MANRNFSRFQALEKEVKAIHAKVAIGAAGAPTLDAVNSKGFKSIVRTAAGQYTVTLEGTWNRLLDVHATIISATAQDSEVQVASETVASTKTVVIRTLTAATATDLSTGTTLLLKLELKNSSVA